MRQTPVNDYLEDISTELPEEIYGHLSDAIYETVCEFDEEVAQLKDENARLQEVVSDGEENARLILGESRTLRAENAKLRELITDVHEALCSDKAGMFHKLILASMEDDMREMGIEACK